MKREEALKLALRAAVAGGNVLVERYGDVLNVTVKESRRDIVTEVDRLAEECVCDVLRGGAGGIPVVAEERGTAPPEHGGSYWIVDALDGTVNYINRVMVFCVSVAYVEEGVPSVGVILNPVVSDLYYGAAGIGVFKNQERLSFIDKPAEECLFAAAFSGKHYDPLHRREEEYLLFGEINDASRGCLRTGSAAMNLAYLAEGKIGGCFGKANKFCDVAAGLVLARLAGARVEFRMAGEDVLLASYLATVPSAWDAVHALAANVLGL